jgi:hypothetical protein
MPIRLRAFIPRSRSWVVFAVCMACYCVVLQRFVTSWAYVSQVRPPSAAEHSFRNPASEVLASLVFAPVVETLILAGIMEVARRAHASEAAQVFAGALIVSAGHAWPWWLHAVVVIPSFLIQAASYLYWRRVSWKTAFWVVVLIHAIINLIPTLNVIGRAARQT